MDQGYIECPKCGTHSLSITDALYFSVCSICGIVTKEDFTADEIVTITNNKIDMFEKQIHKLRGGLYEMEFFGENKSVDQEESRLY